MDDFFNSPSPADPYDGVVLGVECAWPMAEWHTAGDDGAPEWAAQYTVSTGTPNR